MMIEDFSEDIIEDLFVSDPALAARIERDRVNASMRERSDFARLSDLIPVHFRLNPGEISVNSRRISGEFSVNFR